MGEKMVPFYRAQFGSLANLGFGAGREATQLLMIRGCDTSPLGAAAESMAAKPAAAKAAAEAEAAEEAYRHGDSSLAGGGFSGGGADDATDVTERAGVRHVERIDPQARRRPAALERRARRRAQHPLRMLGHQPRALGHRGRRNPQARHQPGGGGGGGDGLESVWEACARWGEPIAPCALPAVVELREMQDDITAARRVDLIGTTVNVLVDSQGVGRSHREAPEIDGVVHVPQNEAVGSFVDVEIVDALGPDLVAAGTDLNAIEDDS